MKYSKFFLPLFISLTLILASCQQPGNIAPPDNNPPSPPPVIHPTLTETDLPLGLTFAEVTCDDGLTAFLAQGGVTSTAKNGEFISSLFTEYPGLTIRPYGPSAACSAFLASDGNGGYYAGRNFDWGTQSDAVIIRNKPSNGDYASVSTFNKLFVNFKFPEGMSEETKKEIIARTGIYVPLDGVNEKGLVVAVLNQEAQGGYNTTDENTSKPDLTITTAVRLLLNRAKNVDEAIALLKQYDMHSDIYLAHHLFIADASGKSAVAEWDNIASKGMRITYSRAVTNHPLYKYEDGLTDANLTGYENSVSRYRTVLEALDAKNNVVTFDEAKDILHSVHQGDHSKWSIVYHITADYSEETFYWNVSENWETKKGLKFSVK